MYNTFSSPTLAYDGAQVYNIIEDGFKDIDPVIMSNHAHL